MMKHAPDPETFNQLVWQITRQIPQGQVSTYGQIASIIPPPDGVEPDDYKRLGAIWVGQALNQTPADQGIPWQRVINSKGGISLPGATADQQRQRLLAESIVFDNKGLVDLNRYVWDGPDADWLKERGLRKPQSLRKPGSDMQQLSLF